MAKKIEGVISKDRPGPIRVKGFGFSIHGCIDGFSRKILWNFVSLTDNNPCVTAAVLSGGDRGGGGGEEGTQDV